MTNRSGRRSAAVALALLGLLAAPARGEDPPEAPKAEGAPEVEAAPQPPLPCPWGWQLMSEQEMQAHHARMRAAATPQEREEIRREHHALMAERAKERGVTLPEKPASPCPGWPGMRGRGMGPGHGMGPGRGMGPGMGPGPGAGGGPGTGPGAPPPVPPPPSPPPDSAR